LTVQPVLVVASIAENIHLGDSMITKTMKIIQNETKKRIADAESLYQASFGVYSIVPQKLLPNYTVLKILQDF
jgi:uncharacterized protein (UPF0333 family)